MIRRREFITLIGGAAAAWPLAAHAQQAERMRRIAVLMGTTASELGEGYLTTFLQRLDELGWRKSRNILIDVRWWTGGPEQMQTVVAELLSFSPDVVMVFSNLALALLKPMAGTVPIVFVGVGDPIGDGFVDSLARPGGNITGFSSYDGPMGGKWLEVLKEAAPHLARVIALLHQETPIHQRFWQSTEAAAARVGIDALAGGVHDAAEIEAIVTSFAEKPNGGLIVFPHALTNANSSLIVSLALRYRLPSAPLGGSQGGSEGGRYVSPILCRRGRILASTKAPRAQTKMKWPMVG
jgi:putative ABC transport system substrate-binding protein